MPSHKKNLFEMGANFEEGWSSDNKEKAPKNSSQPCKEVLTPQKHQLYFAKEKRRGKIVTIVKPFCLKKEELQSLLKTIKKRLGTGGTIKEGALELQGDIQAKLKSALETMEFRFKK